MMNSIDWLIAYFGIIRTGAWAVPLNFRFTGSDIQYCCDVAEPKCMVFGEEFIDRISGIKDDLHTVKHYIFVGKEFRVMQNLLIDSLRNLPLLPPIFKLSTMTLVVSISPPAPRDNRNPFF